MHLTASRVTLHSQTCKFRDFLINTIYDNLCMDRRGQRTDTSVLHRLRCVVEGARARSAPQTVRTQQLVPSLQHRLAKQIEGAAASMWSLGARESKHNLMDYMQLCRKHLAKLDTLGWNRSYHHHLFHDDFLKTCQRSFWKLEPSGQFARDHKRVLRVNSWDHIAQEILISTPRRFGKTISVSMFCAAMMLSCPGVEISIYSTCKRISQKILRNVQKFALLIADSDYATLNFSVKRENMEEINLQGLLGNTDIHIINSYPSKVCFNHIRQKSKSRKVKKSKSMLVKRLHHLHELASGQEEGLLRVRGAHQREHVLQELCQQSVVVLSLEQEILQQEKEVTRFAADVKQRTTCPCTSAHG